jgi:hypothetical protein
MVLNRFAGGRGLERALIPEELISITFAQLLPKSEQTEHRNDNYHRAYQRSEADNPLGTLMNNPPLQSAPIFSRSTVDTVLGERRTLPSIEGFKALKPLGIPAEQRRDFISLRGSPHRRFSPRLDER